MAGRNVGVTVYYKTATASKLAEEVTAALKSHLVTIENIAISQSGLENLAAQISAAFGGNLTASLNTGLAAGGAAMAGLVAQTKEATTAATEMSNALSKAVNTGISNNPAMTNAFAGISTGAKNAADAISHLENVEAEQSKAHSEYVRQAEVVQKKLQEFFNSGANGNALYAGLQNLKFSVSGEKATFTAINEEMGKTVTFVGDLSTGIGQSAEKAEIFAKNLESVAKITTTIKELPKVLSPTEASAQRDNILAALRTASADGSTPALAGLTDWQARLSGTKAIFTAINTNLKQSVSVTADLRTHVGDTEQSAAQFAQNLTAANIATKDETSSIDSEATKLARLRSQAEQYLTLKGKILKENAPDVYNRLDSLYRKSFTPGAVTSAEFQKEYSAIQSQIFQTGADIQSLWQRIKSAAEIAFTFYNLYGVFNRVKRVVKDMVQTVGELDQSMTQLSIVSNESMKTIESNFGNISKAAKEAGADITDLMASMENYARMGYNMEESTDLAKLTSIYSNVGDISVNDATTSAVSILKAYGLSVNELKQAFDSMTKVDQDFAISTGDLGVAFQNTGSQLAATGASVNETIALITAANSSIQDASKTANALKTISMRLRSQNLTQKEREELSELSGEDIDDIVNNSSKYRNEILGMTGVDIKENESTYKSIYQIILEISKVWDHLSDTQRATLTEDIAGKRNSSVLMSLISNVDDMEAAYADAENAMGTLDAANAKYLDSIEGKQKAFQASYQSLAHTLINSGFVKLFYDMGNGAVQFAEALQKVNLLIPALVAGLVALNAAMKAIQATRGAVKLLTTPEFDVTKAVDVFGGLSANRQKFAGMMMSAMDAADKAKIFGGGVEGNAARDWFQASLLNGTVGTFSGANAGKIQEYIRDGVTDAVGGGVKAGAKAAGEVARKSIGETFDSIKIKASDKLAELKKVFSGEYGVGMQIGAFATAATAAVAIGTLIYRAVDAQLTKTIEAYTNLKQEISDTENKIREAQSQLDENNAKIEEYTEKKAAAGLLSFSDQTTLDALKAEQTELQANIELLEAYKKLKEEAMADTAWEALKAEDTKAFFEHWKDYILHPFTGRGFEVYDRQTFLDAFNLYSGKMSDFDRYGLTSQYGVLPSNSELASGMGEWITSHREQLDALAYGVDEKIDEIIDAYHRFDAYTLANAGNFDSAFTTLINAPEFAKTKRYLEDIIDVYGGTADNVSEMVAQMTRDQGNLNDVDLDDFLEALKEVSKRTDDIDFTELIVQFGRLSDSIAGLEPSTDSLNQFQTALSGIESEVEEWEKNEKGRKSGTEAFTSYAETYDKLIERIEQDFDENDDLVSDYIERLIGKDKLFEIIENGGDLAAVMDYIKKGVGTAFGDNDSLGSDLTDLISKTAKAGGEGWRDAADGVREFVAANNEVVMSFDKSDNSWKISSDHMKEAAEALGLTTEELYILMQALDTHSDLSLLSDKELEESIINGDMGFLLGEGKKAVSKIELTAAWDAAGLNTFEQAELLKRLIDNPNVIVIGTEFTGDAEKDLKTLERYGVVTEDLFGNRLVSDLGGVSKLLKDSGVGFSEAFDELKELDLFDSKTGQAFDLKDEVTALVEAYSDGKVKVDEFYDTIINSNGEEFQTIKFASLSESLRDAGFSKSEIDRILNDLSSEAGVLQISASASWKLNPDDLREQLASMGIIRVGSDGKHFALNYDVLARHTIEQGGNKRDAIDAVNKIKSIVGEGSFKFDSSAFDSAWKSALDNLVDKQNAQTTAIEKTDEAAGNLTTTLSGISDILLAWSGHLSGVTTKFLLVTTVARGIRDILSKASEYASSIAAYLLPLFGKSLPSVNSGSGSSSGSSGGGSDKLPMKMGHATGKNKDKYSGLSLVGELGPEIRATDGMVEVVGKNGPEVITVGKEDIIIPADTTEDILKKTGGVIDGIASNANLPERLKPTPKRVHPITGKPITGGKTTDDARWYEGGGNDPATWKGGGGESSGSSSSSSSSSSSAESAASTSKDAWDRFYKNLKHQREMDEIDDKQYYAALEANYRNYLDTSEENLDTWQSVVEEIYKGNYSTLTDLWNNELAEWDHKIAMEQATEADKIAWMKSHYSEYLSDNIQQHKDYQKALEEIRSGEYKLLTDAWEKELAEWDHKIAMEEAEEAEKTEWMKANLGNYLSDNLTQHSDYEKALESIYDGEAEAQTKAWDEIKDNLDRQLAMNEITEKEYWARYVKAYRETLVGNQKKVAEERLKADKDYYEATKKLAEDAIRAQTDKLKRQLDNQIITNRNYLMQLAQLYEKNYAKINELDADSVEARKDALNDLYSAQKTYASNNASDIKNLHDLVVEEIKDIKNQEIDQLEETAANLSMIADLRKQAIDDLETENDYIRQQRNLQKSAAQLEAELEMMKSDTSAAGMAKRRKLQEQLISAQADLSDFEREHAISNQKKQIDEELKEKTKQLDEQKKEIQKYLANELQVSADAWLHINDANAKGVKGIKDLYDELSNYALSFGKDIQGEIDTVVAKFQEAMKAVTKDFGIAMKAFADSGMGPIAMLNVLEQADVKFGDNVRADVTKALREGGGDNINYGWNDMSEAAMFAALATATDEIGASLNLSTIADIVQRKAQQALLLPESKASDFTKEFKERGISVSEVVNALNEKLEAEGSTLRANAEDYETLNKWLEENEVSTYLFTKAVDEHSKSVTRNKFAWNGAVRAAKEGASEWIRVASQFENVNNWIKSCDSSYGAFKLSLQTADIEIPPDFERFITGLKDKIKGNPTALYETFDEAMTGITKSASNAQGGEDGKGGLHGILGLMNGDIDETVGKLAMITPNASGEKSKVDQVKDGLKTVFDWMGKVVGKFNEKPNGNNDPLGLNAAADSTQNFHDNLKNLAENIPGYANVIAAAMGKINDAQKGDSTQNPSGFTNDDVRKVLQAASGEVTLTPAEAVRYDLNFDGVITEADAELMQRMVGKLDTGIGYTGEPSSESNPTLDKVLDGVVSIFGIMGAAVDDYNNVLTGKGTFSGEPVPEANKEAVKETTETILGVGKKIIGLLGKPEPEAVPEGNAEYVEQTSEALGGILKNLFGAVGRASGGYASGTSSVPANGMYNIDEGMRDELIYDPSKNALISYLNAKSIVFPADVSAKMKALYNNPSLLNASIGSPSIPRMNATVNAVSVGDISMGDIIIQGNTNEKTIAQIRAEQKRQAQYIGDIFEREQRFAGTIR